MSNPDHNDDSLNDDLDYDDFKEFDEVDCEPDESSVC